MKKDYLLVLAILIILSSCNVQEPLSDYSFSTQKFPEHIGTFNNRMDSATWEGSSLWSQLVFLNETDTTDWRIAKIKLTLLSEETLRAEYLVNGFGVDCAILKGELKENEFKLKNQYKYLPLIIVIAATTSSNTRIALKDSSALLAENSRTGIVLLGSILPIFGGGGANSIYLYNQ